MGLREKFLRVIGGDDFAREEPHFRDRHVAFGGTDLDYERARPAYEYGFVMATDARWRDRSFDEAEPGLTEGWESEYATQSGSWDAVRGWVQRAWHRAREVAGLESPARESVAAEAPEPEPRAPEAPESRAPEAPEPPRADEGDVAPPGEASRIPSRPES